MALVVMHSRTRQVVAMQVGPRSRQTAEKLFYKLPESSKQNSSFCQNFVSMIQGALNDMKIKMQCKCLITGRSLAQIQVAPHF